MFKGMLESFSQYKEGDEHMQVYIGAIRPNVEESLVAKIFKSQNSLNKFL